MSDDADMATIELCADLTQEECLAQQECQSRGKGQIQVKECFSFFN